MTDDTTARTARGNPRPPRATRAPRRPHPDQCEVTLLVSTSCQNTAPLDEVAVSALLEFLAMEQIKACPQAGVTPSRLHQRGHVVGWDTTWLHVCFERDHAFVVLRAHLVRALNPDLQYQQVLHRREHASHARRITVVPRLRTTPH